MRLDTFSIPREVFMIIRQVTCHEEQYKLISAVYSYIYEDDDYPSKWLRYGGAIRAFEKIKAIIDKPLTRARKAKARRDDRKAHPEKYPPRRKSGVRKAGAVELPSGHVIESSKKDSARFDYYCVKGNKVLYFKMIATGEVDGDRVSFTPAFSPDSVMDSFLKCPAPVSRLRFRLM